MEAQAKTRLLLALWDLGGAKLEVKKGELTKRIATQGKKVADYQDIFEELEKLGAIAISKKGYSLVSPNGLEVLGEGLKSRDFRFEGTIVGTWAANALLKWISEMNGVARSTFVQSNGVKSAIASYDEFEKVTLEVYDRLNRDDNLDDLVPIYRIRREIGELVSRKHFNEWMLEIQANDILQLQGGSLPDKDPTKLEDSITTEVSGLRCRQLANFTAQLRTYQNNLDRRLLKQRIDRTPCDRSRKTKLCAHCFHAGQLADSIPPSPEFRSLSGN